MARFSLKYADPRGEIHQQVIDAESEKELRDRFTEQGYLIYSIRQRQVAAGLPAGLVPGGGKKVNLEKFLIFNQQFLTLVRAGLPILKGLDLLADRLTDPKLGRHIKEVRDEVKRGTLLSDAFRKQGVFPAMYVTSVMAGEKSGSLGEVLERFIAYQRLALAVRKKMLLSLIYPSILVFLVICLDRLPDHLRGPEFRAAIQQHVGPAAADDPVALIAVGTTAQKLHPGGGVDAGRRRRGAPHLVPEQEWAQEGRPGEGANARPRQAVAEVSGRPAFPRAQHAADGRHPAGAGAGHRHRVDGEPAAAGDAGEARRDS